MQSMQGQSFTGGLSGCFREGAWDFWMAGWLAFWLAGWLRHTGSVAHQKRQVTHAIQGCWPLATDVPQTPQRACNGLTETWRRGSEARESTPWNTAPHSSPAAEEWRVEGGGWRGAEDVGRREEVGAPRRAARCCFHHTAIFLITESRHQAVGT